MHPGQTERHNKKIYRRQAAIFRDLLKEYERIRNSDEKLEAFGGHEGQIFAARRKMGNACRMRGHKHNLPGRDEFDEMFAAVGAAAQRNKGRRYLRSINNESGVALQDLTHIHCRFAELWKLCEDEKFADFRSVQDFDRASLQRSLEEHLESQLAELWQRCSLPTGFDRSAFFDLYYQLVWGEERFMAVVWGAVERVGVSREDWDEQCVRYRFDGERTYRDAWHYSPPDSQ